MEKQNTKKDTENGNNSQDTIKEVGNLKATFSRGLDKTGEKAFLSITIDREIQDILKQLVINEITDYKIYLGRNEDRENQYKTLKRYLVKKVIFNSIGLELYNIPKEILFLKDLVDNG